ncbi:hypothetical protein KSP40_PGU020848 [Platanthera guangdongensis]|uniref:Uncharacterized protein n=1 Tax=Platanthera guangdongensis TaxID=2320717 RepID=A0ABR2M2W8_9ASPA
MATVVVSASIFTSRARVRASWDTNPSSKPLQIPKPSKPSRSFPVTSPAVGSSFTEKENELPLSDFLSSGRHRPQRDKATCTEPSITAQQTCNH